MELHPSMADNLQSPTLAFSCGAAWKNENTNLPFALSFGGVLVESCPIVSTSSHLKSSDLGQDETDNV